MKLGAKMYLTVVGLGGGFAALTAVGGLMALHGWHVAAAWEVWPAMTLVFAAGATACGAAFYRLLR